MAFIFKHGSCTSGNMWVISVRVEILQSFGDLSIFSEYLF